jgi:hypothetical protein
MNILVLLAGCLSAFVVLGHFIFGINWYLKPMLKSEFPIIPKATMQSVFHYVSIFLVLSSAILIAIGIGKLPQSGNVLLIKFIGINYILFAIIQISYSIKHKVERPLVVMFQWTMFLPIGILCLI